MGLDLPVLVFRCLFKQGGISDLSYFLPCFLVVVRGASVKDAEVRLAALHCGVFVSRGKGGRLIGFGRQGKYACELTMHFSCFRIRSISSLH